MLLLEYHDLSVDHFSKGDGRIYAMLFNPFTGEALDFSTITPYELDDFDGDQERFSIILPLTENRSRHYSELLEAGEFTLPDTDYGKYYTIEYWAEAVSGTQDRDDDYFLATERLMWSSATRVESQLSEDQEQAIADRAAHYVGFCSAVYDTTNERVSFMAWLELNGALQTDAIRAVIEMTDVNGNTVASLTITTIESEGHFKGAQDGVTLSPDETYFLTATLRDAGGTDHKSGSGPVTWD